MATATVPDRAREIHGRVIERIGTSKCIDCGRPGGIFREFAPGPATLGTVSEDGRNLRYRSPDRCVSCAYLENFEATRPGFRGRVLERGLRRDLVSASQGERSGLGTFLAKTQAEALGDVLSADTGDWIPVARFEAHPFYASIRAIVDELRLISGPIGYFNPGLLKTDQDVSAITIHDRDILKFIDRHARGDHGEHGKLPIRPSEDTIWCPCDGVVSIAEINSLSVEKNDGIVRSRYNHSDSLAIEIVTTLYPMRLASTVVLTLGRNRIVGHMARHLCTNSTS